MWFSLTTYFYRKNKQLRINFIKRNRFVEFEVALIVRIMLFLSRSTAKIWIIFSVLITLLSGCASDSFHYSDPRSGDTSYKTNNARVSEVPSSGYYRVQKGDTLFSIAFRYGVDYKTLAQTNRISDPYIIYPNQKIRFNASQKVASSTSKSVTNKAPSVVVNDAAKSTNKPNAIKVNPTIKRPSTVDPTVKSRLNWQWPIDGFVVRGFSNSGVSSKGIDIKGVVGKPVLAAEDGIVVYAGNGLIGYGNLVILKHNEEYLSAYAYNQNILVKEQQQVKMGDSLAIIGGKGEERPLLHFEIRRDGQPIDPLKVLPKK